MTARSPRRSTILVVEDDAQLRRLLTTALVFEGFDTVDARSGPEALVVLDSHRPDLIVWDLFLSGNDGFAVRQAIASSPRTRHVPIVIITDTAMSQDDDIPAGLTRQLFDVSTVVTAVRQCLRDASR